MDRTKLLLMTPNLQGGGAEKVMVNLLNSFDRNRIEPVFMTAELKGPYTSLLPADVEIVDLGVSRVRYVLPKLVKEINRIRPDAILSTFERLNFSLLLAKPFIPKATKIVIREVNLPSKTLMGYGSVRKTLYRQFYRKLYPLADRIIAQSDKMNKEIVAYSGVGADKVTTIHNPIDVGVISALSGVGNPFEGRSGIQIVSAGRLEHQKGFDLLVQAFKLFHDRYPQSTLHILGEGSLRGELERLASTLGIGSHVNIAGFQENPYPYIRYSDLFVLSSRYEGFPNVLLEALACKAKIVAADCDSGPRDILLKPEQGLLAKPDSVVSLAEAMLRGVNDPHLGSQGFARAMDYDCSQVTCLYERALTS